MSFAGRLLGVRAAQPARATQPQRTSPGAATKNIAWTAPNMPMQALWDADAALQVGYYGHIYHYRCARKIAATIAGLPLRAGKDPDQPGQFNVQSPLARLLGPPPGGPTPNITPRQLLTWSIVSYLITGRWAWETPTLPRSNVPTGLWPLVAAKLQPVVSTKAGEWFSGFEYQLNAERRKMTPDQVFYAWRPAQTDWRQPESAMQAMALPTQMAVALDRYMVAFMRNNMVGSKLVVTPGFDDDDMRRSFQDQFLAELTGAHNAGRTAFAEYEDDGLGDNPNARPAVQVVDLGSKLVDAQALEWQKAIRDVICDGWGMPVSILGQAAERTYENADQEHRNYWTGPVLETIAEIQDLINIGLAPRFGTDEVAWFDLSKVAALKPAQRFTQITAKDAVDSNIATVGEVRDDLRLDPDLVPDADAADEVAPVADDTPAAGGGSTTGATQRAAATAVRPTEVEAYLADNYPQRVLGWVRDAAWERRRVPLSDIRMARRPGGRDWEKVEAIAKAVKDGKAMDPVVLVDTGEDKLEIADGYHRTLAFDRAGQASIEAYVGSGVGRHGPWETEMHAAKLNRSDEGVAAARRLGERVADNGHLVATERLMRYWAEGEGAAKIRWGVPGDFNRCRAHLGKYVRPDELNGLCANLHHRATGAWPGHAPSEQRDDAPNLIVETSTTGKALLPVAGRPALVPHLPVKGEKPGVCAACGRPARDPIHRRRAARHAGPGHPGVQTGHHSAARRRTAGQVDAHATTLEPRMETVMRAVFTQQRKATVDRLNGNRGRQMLRAAQEPASSEGGEPAPLLDAQQVFDYGHWVTKTQEALVPLYAAIQSLTEGRLETFASTPTSRQTVQDALTARSVKLAQTVSRTTFDQILQALSDGVAHGKSIGELTTAINGIFDDADRGRAQTIARTEVIGALNTAADAHADALGPDVVAGKEWIATHDARTRPAHRAADGQIRAMGVPFTVGGYPLEHPGDPTAPPGEVINCRCTTGYLTPAEYAQRTGNASTITPPIAA